jgi:hypothetical protein
MSTGRHGGQRGLAKPLALLSIEVLLAVPA